MIELYLPYLFGLAIGMTGPADGEASGPAAAATAEAAPARAPEDQTPTGQFTTAAEIRPILLATTGNWVGVRDWNGQDLVYFTHLLAWRCGLWDIHYGVNGGPADTALPMEPCNTDTATPNALTDIENFLPYVSFPAGSVEEVSVTITFDDGEEMSMTYPRAQVQMP